MTWLRSFPQRYPWFWRNAPYAVMAGIILAFVLLAALPQGVCLGDCGARDKWCNANCTVACQSGTVLKKVDGCHWSDAIGACADEVKNEAVACAHSSDCNVTSGSRLHYQGGYSYWWVGACKREPGVPQQCDFVLTAGNNARVDCCGNGGGGGGGCTPDYAPPVIHAKDAAFSPPYPLTLGQDPDRLGVAVTVTAEGGKDKNNCGGAKPKITDFKVTGIDLAESSRNWILTDLAAWYPGATILGDYPMLPDQSSLQGKNTSKATLWFHFNPLDPGFYKVTVVATQDKGSQKSSTAVITVPVYLIETTTIR